MAGRDRNSGRQGERGITLVYVALSMFALLGMAALAIDLITLYVGKSQVQRAADAGALAGAKTLVDRGITADPLDTRDTWTATCVQATAQAQVIANRARIGGVAPAMVTPCFQSGGACTAACPAPSVTIGTGFGVNPQVMVTVQSAPLPLFFAKIWGRSTATVSATGLAEGFNPSGTDVPVAAKCVTPWLLPNIDPVNGTQIFDPGTGAMINNQPSTTGSPAGFIGEQMLLQTGCPGGCSTTVAPVGTPGPPYPPKLSYYPLDLPNPAASGPSCSVGASYQQNIAACNPTPIACGSTVNLDATAGPTDVADNQSAIDCRIGAAGTGMNNGQDVVDVTVFPFALKAGSTHNGVGSGTQISTSRAVVTIPVYDSAAVGKPVSPVTVIGFVQAFVDSSNPVTGEPTIHILNVSGCGTTARSSGLPPVGINESSAVPVRLIHQ